MLIPLDEKSATPNVVVSWVLVVADSVAPEVPVPDLIVRETVTSAAPEMVLPPRSVASTTGCTGNANPPDIDPPGDVSNVRAATVEPGLIVNELESTLPAEMLEGAEVVA